MAITPRINNESQNGRLAAAGADFGEEVFTALVFPGGFFTDGLKIFTDQIYVYDS